MPLDKRKKLVYNNTMYHNGYICVMSIGQGRGKFAFSVELQHIQLISLFKII